MEQQRVKEHLIALAVDYSEQCNSGHHDEHSADDLIAYLQNNDCRAILSVAADRDEFAEMFTHAADIKDFTLLQLCVEQGINVDILDCYGSTALIYACSNTKTNIASYLLDHHANIDIQDDSGINALMSACLIGCCERVQLLLDHNANIDLKSKKGTTALDKAKNEEIKELLLNHVTASYVLK